MFRTGLRSLRSALTWALGTCGVAHALLKARSGTVLTVLNYHEVNDRADRYGPRVSEANFRRHVGYLSRHGHVGQLEALLPKLQSGPAPPGPLFAITFDDGYRDVRTAAYPILAEHGTPATVFLMAHAVESGALPWPEQVAGILDAAAPAPLSFGDARLDLSTSRARHDAWETIIAAVGPLAGDERRQAIDQLACQAGIAPGEPPGESLLLDRDDVSAMDPAIMAVGSHGLTHAPLATLPRAEAEHEIAASRQVLESHLQRPVCGLSFPNDSHAAWMAPVARAAGYTYACHVGGCANPLPLPDPFAIKRVHVEDWSLPRFIAELGPCGHFARNLSRNTLT